ncbi:hypothetical protein LINGRAPRIM_LOCUS2733 [Linum grandiflorum]
MATNTNHPSVVATDDVEDVGVEIAGLLLDEEIDEYELCLVGLLTTARNINLTVMRDRLAMLWRPGQGMAVEDLGEKNYLF